MKQALIKIGKGILYVGGGVIAGAVLMGLVALLPIGATQQDAAVAGAVVGGVVGLVFGFRQKFA